MLWYTWFLTQAKVSKMDKIRKWIAGFFVIKQWNAVSFFSAMESHRRFGLIFYPNVLLPSKAWFHDHDVGPFIWFSYLRIRHLVCDECHLLHRLYRTRWVSVIASHFIHWHIFFFIPSFFIGPNFTFPSFFFFLRLSFDWRSNHTRITIDEVIVPYDACIESIHGFSWLIIFLSTLFWLFRVVRFFYHAVQYYDIKKFFNTALKIDDVSAILFSQFFLLLLVQELRMRRTGQIIIFSFNFQSELGNYTWHEVQRRIREVQTEQQMCIHKENLTELDIYHRILRCVRWLTRCFPDDRDGLHIIDVWFDDDIAW